MNAEPSPRLPGLPPFFAAACPRQRTPNDCPSQGVARNRAALGRVMGAPETPPLQENFMLYWALMFLVVALVAALFGFGGIASTATGIAQILFVIALVMFLVTLVANFIRRST